MGGLLTDPMRMVSTGVPGTPPFEALRFPRRSRRRSVSSQHRLLGSGGKAVAVQGDVSKAPDVQRLFAETKREWCSTAWNGIPA